jgi:hypothetical protein
MQTGIGKGFSGALASLGLGDQLAQQVENETEDERKRRMSRAQQMNVLGPAAMSLGLTGVTSGQ